MYEHRNIQKLEDFFATLENRPDRGVYFYRFDCWNAQIEEFLRKYYETARRFGVIIEGKIPNPDEKNLAYYEEIMGTEFLMSVDFITYSLQKWLPRMNGEQRKNVAIAIYDSLDDMRKDGKNANMQKNAYIKFMCWLYYRFERIVNLLGNSSVPKILYEGEVGKYELMMLSILSNAGCDVILLQYHGDANYQKIDAASHYSNRLMMQGTGRFPEYFCLKWLRDKLQSQAEAKRLYGELPPVQNCTNAWIKGKGLEEIKIPPKVRGNDPKLFYNCFFKISGAEDKLTYLNELYQLQLEQKNSGRPLVILDNEIPKPTVEEINSIRRKNYVNKEQMLLDLASNIRASSNNLTLQRLMHKAFIDVLTKAAEETELNLNKLTNKAVYLLCWMKRYQSKLFSNWTMPNVSCFFYMNGCKNDTEALFLKFLSKLPVDVCVFLPNLNQSCCLEDRMLYEIHYRESLTVEKFPTDGLQIRIGTAAYHAERELDQLMYQDSGIYRSQQYAKANALILNTTYEEIGILWEQELKYRPNFSTIDAVVNLPVIFSKISGVKDGMVQQYWQEIKKRITDDTIVAKSLPYLRPTDANPIKAYVTEFFKNGKLQKEKIKSHRYYPYGFLREEMQEHILEKLQFLIASQTIRGTFENGTEYTIIATVLNLGKEITRLLQKFDFTKKNPKFIYINTTEQMCSLEDSIFAAFLNLAGFDVVFFSPTGYQGIEKYFNRNMMEEHQIGEYVYDLTVPDFEKISSGTRFPWREKIFKRGN